MSKKYVRSVGQVFVFLLVMFFAAKAKADVILAAGTEVQVVFDQEVSSKYVAPGDIIPIRLHGAINYGGIIVVKDGAVGTARVKSVKPAGRGGKPGEVEVVLVGLEPDGAYKAEGDKKIKLQAITEDGTGTIRAKGKGRKLLSYLFIFGLFIKGSEAVIPADKPFPAKITEEIVILSD